LLFAGNLTKQPYFQDIEKDKIKSCAIWLVAPRITIFMIDSYPKLY